MEELALADIISPAAPLTEISTGVALSGTIWAGLACAILVLVVWIRARQRPAVRLRRMLARALSTTPDAGNEISELVREMRRVLTSSGGAALRVELGHAIQQLDAERFKPVTDNVRIHRILAEMRASLDKDDGK